MSTPTTQQSASSDPKSPEHVCTPACTHEGATKPMPAAVPPMGTVRTTNAPTRPGEGSTHSSR